MKATPEITVRTATQSTMSSWNQLFSAPSSRTYCIAIRKVVIRPSPHQSMPLAMPGSGRSKSR